jgi:hypothetical protein
VFSSAKLNIYNGDITRGLVEKLDRQFTFFGAGSISM